MVFAWLAVVLGWAGPVVVVLAGFCPVGPFGVLSMKRCMSLSKKMVVLAPCGFRVACGSSWPGRAGGRRASRVLSGRSVRCVKYEKV